MAVNCCLGVERFVLYALDPGSAARLADGDFGSLENAPNLQETRERLREIARSTLELYRKRKSAPPWLGYLCRDELGRIVGTSAFVGPPDQGSVEIAYHSLVEYEGLGVATAMARQLVEIARRTDSSLRIIAFTRPEKNASTRILERLGFSHTGESVDEEIGRAWRWEMTGK